MITFKSFPKIDAHFHSTSYDPIYEKIASDYNVRFLNINTDANVFPPLHQQESIAREYMQKDKQKFAYLASFGMDGWEEPGWLENTMERITTSIENGASGIKIWKNIGMDVIRSSDNSYLMIDDEFFDPLFIFFIKNRIPVLTHLGEPKNCWLPLEEMNSKRNQMYYANHPEFHAYLHPEIPNYEAQITARDNLLVKYPELILVGAHLGSLEWSYEELSKRLIAYPNFYVDVSSRLGHLQIQSAKNYEGVRDFFLKHDDRIIYGTDAYNNPEKLTSSLENDWQFLATHEKCSSDEVAGEFKGLQLPEASLNKIYFSNATKVYHSLKFSS